MQPVCKVQEQLAQMPLYTMLALEALKPVGIWVWGILDFVKQ